MARNWITRVWLPGRFREGNNFYSAYLLAPVKLGASPMFGFTQRDGTSCFFWKLKKDEYLVTYEDYQLMEKINDDYMRIPFTKEELKEIKAINVVEKSWLNKIKERHGWYEDVELGKCINLYKVYDKAYDFYYEAALPYRYFDYICINDLKYYLKEEKTSDNTRRNEESNN